MNSRMIQRWITHLCFFYEQRRCSGRIRNLNQLGPLQAEIQSKCGNWWLSRKSTDFELEIKLEQIDSSECSLPSSFVNESKPLNVSFAGHSTVRMNPCIVSTYPCIRLSMTLPYFHDNTPIHELIKGSSLRLWLPMLTCSTSMTPLRSIYTAEAMISGTLATHLYSNAKVCLCWALHSIHYQRC